MDNNNIKLKITKEIYAIADEIDWLHLTISERQKHYEIWTADPNIGGQLEEVIDPRRVRVYLKDTIMKQYSKSKRPDLKKLLSQYSITYEKITREFSKPVSLLCDTRDLYTLAVAKEWKTAIMSAFERGYSVRNLRQNKIFITDHTIGRFVDQSYRTLIQTAGYKLGIEIVWVT